MHSLHASDSAASALGTGLYSKQASIETYARLLSLAELILSAGFDVIVDAVFMHHAQRQGFQRLAENIGCRFVILEFTANEQSLRQRIVSRVKEASDADLVVLEHQLAHWQPLEPNEYQYRLEVNTENYVDPKLLAKRL